MIAAAAPIPNQTQVAAYTVPAGHTGYLRHMRCSLFGTASNRSEGGLFIRPQGQVFRMNVPFDVTGSDSYMEDFVGGIPYDEKTDVVMRIFSASANNLEVIGRFDMVVVKN